MCCTVPKMCPSSTGESAESQECRAMQCKEVPWYTSKKANKTFHRICTREEDFNQATSTVFTALRQRGYCKRKLRHIKSDFLKSKQAPRPRLGTTLNLPLITRYGNMAVQAHKIVKGRFEQFQRGFATLKGYKVMSAYKNLKDILVSTSLHAAPDCGQRRCGACTHLVIEKKYREQCNREERPDSAEDNL